MSRSSLINLHAVIPSSRVNGPGRRMVVFFQGCGRNCPGCFNPETHRFSEARLCAPTELFGKYLREGVEGITISGGEPFAQPEGLAELLRLARSYHGLSTVVYTGCTHEELLGQEPAMQALEHIDVLIDGPYERDKPEPTSLARGSANQRFIFLSGRYAPADFYMPGKVEVTISPDGTVTETGFSRAAAIGF
ncbi:MAG: radical SAM protein [Deltaproteobacteria bacterium]|nr:radical SAM protein [Deltaproteobacteria bacterium]